MVEGCHVAMELGQMIVQGQWGTDSPLLQIPHFNRDLAKKCKQLELKVFLI